MSRSSLGLRVSRAMLRMRMSCQRARESIARGGALSRLPDMLLLRQAGSQPKYVLRIYLLLLALFVPLYFLDWAVAAVASWIGSLLLWSSIFWTLGRQLASAIVFPGSLRQTARGVEHGIAFYLKQRVDALTSDIISCSRQTQMPPGHVLDAIEKTLKPIAEATKLHVEESKLGPKAQLFSEALTSFTTALAEWRKAPADLSIRQKVISFGEAIIQDSNTILDCREESKSVKSRRSNQVSPEGEYESDVDEDDGLNTIANGQGGNNVMSSAADTEPYEDVEANDIDDNDDDDGDVEMQLERKRTIQLSKVNFWVKVWTVLVNQVEKYMATRRPYVGLASFDFMRKYLQIALGGEVRMINSDGYNIDTCFFPWDEQVAGTSERRVVIVCNPNAGRYEHAVWNPHWIHFYRERGNAVMLWNYRGYGRSEGQPSPTSLKTDVESIVRYLREEHGCTKFSFHGESIGGIPACHGIVNCENTNGGLLICDRTFASLHRVAASIAGDTMARLMHLFTGWVADNTLNFLNGSSVANRLILQDPDDEIVHHDASLKIGVAECLVEQLDVFSRGEVEQVYDAFFKIMATMERFRMERAPGVDSLIKLIRFLHRMEGGHGETMQAALVREKMKRDAVVAFSNTKLGKVLNYVNVALAKVGIKRRSNATPEQDYFFDWFACAFVFGDAQSNVTSFTSFVRLVNDASAVHQQADDDLKNALQKVKEFCERFIQLIQKSHAREGEWSEKSKRLLRGSLITLRCGHNGSPSRDDILRVDEFLRQGKFVGANAATSSSTSGTAVQIS